MKIPWRTLFLVAVLALVLWIGYAARAVVTPLLAALLLAYVLDPLVRRTQRLGLSRNVASVLTVAVALVTILGIAALTVTRLAQEATSFYHDVVGEPAFEAPSEEIARGHFAESIPTDGKEWTIRSTAWEGRKLWYVDEDGDGQFRPGYARAGIAKLRRDLAASEATAKFAEHLKPTEDLGAMVASSAGRWLAGIADAGRGAAGTLVGLLTLLVLFPIYLYYSLAKLDWVYDVTVKHLPAAHRDRVVEILGKIHATLAAFFRGRLIMLIVKFLVLLGIFIGFGVPFAAVCATFCAVASLVPVIGSVAGGAVAVLLLMAAGSSTPKTMSLVGALIVVEVIEQYVLTPAILGKRVGLHPLTILVATFIAGDLLGIFGMLVAIPLTAVLKILAIEFVLPEVRRQAGLPLDPAQPPAAIVDAPPAVTDVKP